MLFNYSNSLVETFSYMMQLTTLAVTIPFLFSIISFVIILKRSNSGYYQKLTVAIFAFLFTAWIMAGCGSEVLISGLLLFLLGIPNLLLDLQEKKLNNMDDFFIDPDITKAETLPPRFYRSQEIFEKLKETVFLKTWQWIGDSASTVPLTETVHTFRDVARFLERAPAPSARQSK